MMKFACTVRSFSLPVRLAACAWLLVAAGCAGNQPGSTPAQPTQASIDSPAPAPTPATSAGSEVITAENSSQLAVLNQFEVPGAQDFSWCSEKKQLCVGAPGGLMILAAGDASLTQTEPSPTPRLITTSEDGRHVAWVSEDNVIEIWDLTTGVRHTIPSGRERIVGLSFHPLQPQIAVSFGDQWVELWESSTGERVGQFEYPGWLVDLTYTSQGEMLVGAVQEEFALAYLDPASGQELRRLTWSDHASPVLYGAQLSPDQNTAAWVSRGTIQLMDANSGAVGHTLGHEDFINSMDWSPDGRLIASAAAGTLDGQYVPLITLWDSESGQMVGQLAHPQQVLKVDFSPDGSILAALDSNGVIYLWSIP